MQPSSWSQHIIAALAVITVCILISASILCGYMLLWKTEIHKLGFARDLLGLNKEEKAVKKRQAEQEIMYIKAQRRRDKKI
jgi:short subunit fatty acids transporter